MTPNFLSIHAAMPAEVARRYYSALESRQCRRPSHDADETAIDMLETADRLGESFDTVDLDFDAIEEIETAAVLCEVTPSHDAAILAVLDRAVALPRGVSILDGHAFAWLPPERAERVARSWNRLCLELGGVPGVASAAGPRFFSDEVAREVEALQRSMAVARDQQLHLLLISATLGSDQ